MSKYVPERSVGAIYDNAPADNPFLAAMPEMLSQDDFTVQIKSFLKLPVNLPAMTTIERRQTLPLLSSIFVPLDYMYALYDQIYRAIRSTYSTRTMLEEVRQTNALFCGDTLNDYSTQAATGSILGVPGVGKTSTIRRAIGLLPQVIEHVEYMGKPFFCKQVLYLTVECPSDCSVKSLALNLVSALDRAIGSSYLHQLTALRSVAATAVADQVKILCLTHHVGLILIDEIQNAVVTARKNKLVKPLIKFLVELTNDTCTSVFFVGTPDAETLFVSQEHLKRRTRGICLLPFKPDGVYRYFLEQLWAYQLTPQAAPLTDQLANKIYDWSGGIPAYIIKIFQGSQAQALLQGLSCINTKVVQKAIDTLSIKVPRTYSGGTHISDFSFVSGCEPVPAEAAVISAAISAPENPAETSAKEIPRLYANRRGRPAAERDAADLLVALKTGTDMLEHLRSFDLLEEFSIC